MNNTHTARKKTAQCSVHMLIQIIYSYFGGVCLHVGYVYAISPRRRYLCVCISLEIGTDPWFVFCCFFPLLALLYLQFFFNPNKQVSTPHIKCMQFYCFLSNDPKRNTL